MASRATRAAGGGFPPAAHVGPVARGGFFSTDRRSGNALFSSRSHADVEYCSEGAAANLSAPFQQTIQSLVHLLFRGGRPGVLRRRLEPALAGEGCGRSRAERQETE